MVMSPLETRPEPMTCSETAAVDPETVICSETAVQGAETEQDISKVDGKKQTLPQLHSEHKSNTHTTCLFEF